MTRQEILYQEATYARCMGWHHAAHRLLQQARQLGPLAPHMEERAQRIETKHRRISEPERRERAA